MDRPPLYAYVVLLLLGLIAAATPAMLPFADRFLLALLTSTAVFGVVGLICGLLRSGLRWRWGFGGDYATFFADDLPFVIAGLLGASIGAALGAVLRTTAAPRG
jgi:hypothetical protein